MTKRFLIYEPDREVAVRVAEALVELFDGEVTIVSKTREAFGQVMRVPQDLAIIPHFKSSKLVRTLVTVQPDIKLVVTVSGEDDSVTESYADLIHGVLQKDHQDTELAKVVEDALKQPASVGEVEVAPDDGESVALDTATVIGILQQAQLGRLIQAAVFGDGARLVAHWGSLEAAQAATVAMVAGSDWGDSSHTVRVQFITLPARAGDMLLHTRQVDHNHFLTLVARPETPLSELRLESDTLVEGLLEVINEEDAAGTELAGHDPDESAGKESYAIAWRPLKPLPLYLHIPLRRSLARLAATNGCNLIQIEVRPELVHLVVACPPDHDSAWAAYLFKSGAEATIQQEFGLKESLWESGHHAIESREPLSEAELNLLLEREMTE